MKSFKSRALALLMGFFCIQVQAADLYTVRTENSSADRSASLSSAVRGKLRLKVDVTALRAAQAGGEATVTTVGGDRYAVIYDRTEQGFGGGSVWVGHLLDYGKAYPVLISTYMGAVNGTIATPKGKQRLLGKIDDAVLTDIAAAGEKQAAAGVDDTTFPPSLPVFDPGVQAQTRGVPHASEYEIQSLPAATSSSPAQIDLLVLYTNGFAASVGGSNAAIARANLVVATANAVYNNSGINVNLTALDVEPFQVNGVDYPDNDSVPVCRALYEVSGIAGSGACAYQDSGVGAWVAQKRASFGADLVVVLREYVQSNPADTACGRGWLGPFTNDANLIVNGTSDPSGQYGFSVTDDVQSAGAPACDGGSTSAGDTAVTHEIGHNMGAAHDLYTASAPGLGQGSVNGFPAYNRGYCNVSAGTVMAYSSAIGCPSIVPYFSNPLLTTSCGGNSCGIEKSTLFTDYSGQYQATGADSVTAINGTAPYIAAFQNRQQTHLLQITQNLGSTFSPGQVGSYVITVTNNGTAATNGNIVVADTLPAGMTLVSAVGTDWSCTGTAALTCTYTNVLAPGANTVLTLNVQAGTGDIDNTVTVSGGGDAGCPAAAARCSASVGQMKLQVTMTATPNPFVPGTSGKYFITVKNIGSNATNAAITVVDSVLPTGITFYSRNYTSAAPWNCSSFTTQSFNCSSAGILQPGQSAVLEFDANVAGSASNGNQTVTISGGGDGFCSSVSPPSRCSTSVVVPIARVLTVSRSGTGSGTVASSDSTISCGTICTANYAGGTQVTLTATADAGSVFSGWSGGGCSGSGACTVTMNSTQAVTAAFNLPSYSLTVNKSGTGNGTVISNDGAINCGTTCSATYSGNSQVTLTATAASGSTFAGWSGGGCTGNGTCTLTVNSAQSVTAAFALPTYAITVLNTANPPNSSGSGTVTSSDGSINCGTICTANFAPNTQVTFTATPAPGSYFYAWGGICSGSANTCTVTVNAVKALFAYFGPNTLTVQRSGTGSGTVSSADGSINCGTACTANYNVGQQVTLTATPAAGSVISNWNVGGCGTATTCNVPMNAARTVIVTFNLPSITVVNTANPPNSSGSGTVTSNDGSINCGATCTANFAPNTQVTFTATPAPGSYFYAWGGICSGSASTCTVTVNAVKALFAYFGPNTLTVQKSGTGSGSVSSADDSINCGTTCTANYNAGQQVTLTAVPSSDSVLSSWGVGSCSTASTCTVPINAAQTITVTFNRPSLTVTKIAYPLNSSGSGTVSSGDGSINCGATCMATYSPTAQVTLTATPAPGSYFYTWAGACSGSATTCTVPMNAMRYVSAYFGPN